MKRLAAWMLVLSIALVAGDCDDVFVFFGGAAAIDNAADATVNGPQDDGLAGAAIAN